MHKLLVLFLLSSSLQAATYDNKLEFGLKTTSYNYTERDDQDSILDTEDSDLLGINGIYGSFDYKIEEYNKEDSDVAYYINLYTSITMGDTDYTGSVLGSGGGFGSFTSTTENEFYEFQVNIKRLRQYEKSSHYTMLGLGYKEWERALSSNQVETYYYFFLQGVLGGETLVYKDWSIGLDLTAQIAFNPKMDADINAGTEQLHETYDLGTVYTYKLATPLVIPINEQLNFSTKLEYEFSSYGKSNTIVTPSFTPCSTTGCLEPKSQQKNWHLYAGFQLIF